MAERRVNLPSFVAGLLALTFAGLYLIDRTGGVGVDEYVIAAGALVALGVAGIVASVRSMLRGRPSSVADGPELHATSADAAP